MNESFDDLKKKIHYSEGGILSKRIISDGSLDVTLFSMSAKTDISDHTAKKSGFVYVIEGKGTFILEGKKIQMLPGVIIQLKKDQVHSLRAEENTSFILCIS